MLDQLLPINPWAPNAARRRRPCASGADISTSIKVKCVSKLLAATQPRRGPATTVTVPVDMGGLAAAQAASSRQRAATAGVVETAAAETVGSTSSFMTAASSNGHGRVRERTMSASSAAKQEALHSQLSDVSLWRVPGLKADDAAVRTLFRDVLRVPAFVAAGIVACASSVAEVDEQSRKHAVLLAEAVWLTAVGVSRSRPGACTLARDAVTRLLRGFSPIRLGDALCIRAEIDPSLTVTAYDRSLAAQLVEAPRAAAGSDAGLLYRTSAQEGPPQAADPPGAGIAVSACADARSAPPAPGHTDASRIRISPPPAFTNAESRRLREECSAFRDAVIPDNARSCVSTVSKFHRQLRLEQDVDVASYDATALGFPVAVSAASAAVSRLRTATSDADAWAQRHPLSFVSLILPDAHTTTEAVAASRFAEAASTSLLAATEAVRGHHDATSSISTCGGHSSRTGHPLSPAASPSASPRTFSQGRSSSSNPSMTAATAAGTAASSASGLMSGLARMGAAVVSSSTARSGQADGSRTHSLASASSSGVHCPAGEGDRRDGYRPLKAESAGCGSPPGGQGEALAREVTASARKSGGIILGMVARAVTRWPFRRRVSVLQLLRVVSPALCVSGMQRLARAQCVHQALVDIGVRTVEVGGHKLRHCAPSRAPLTATGLRALCRALLPSSVLGTTAEAGMEELFFRAAKSLCSDSGETGTSCSSSNSASISSDQGQNEFVSSFVERLAQLAAGRTPRISRRVPLSAFVGIVDALAERHPDLAPIAASSAMRLRYAEFVLSGVASALGGDHSRGLAMRELRASNLGVALQACATGHLSCVQPFALELFVPVVERFEKASAWGVRSFLEMTADATATPRAATACRSARSTDDDDADSPERACAELPETYPPALRRAAIACLLDATTIPIRAGDGRPLMDPAAARILEEFGELLCLPARARRVSAWQLVASIDAAIPRIIILAIRALSLEPWFAAMHSGSPEIRRIAAEARSAASKAATAAALPPDLNSSLSRTDTPPTPDPAPPGSFGAGITPCAVPGSALLVGVPVEAEGSPHSGAGAVAASGSGGGTVSNGGVEAMSSAMDVSGPGTSAALMAAQSSVLFPFRATTLIALRLISGQVRALHSGMPGMLSFRDWINLECGNGYLGQANLDWLWCAAIEGCHGTAVMHERSIRAAAEERVWDSLRIQSPAAGPATVVDVIAAKECVAHAAYAGLQSVDADAVGIRKHTGHISRVVPPSLKLFRGMSREVLAQSVVVDGAVSPSSLRQVAGGATMHQLQRVLRRGRHSDTTTASPSSSSRSAGSMLSSASTTSGRALGYSSDVSSAHDMTVAVVGIGPSMSPVMHTHLTRKTSPQHSKARQAGMSDKEDDDDSGGDDDIIPLAPGALRDWVRLHVAARQDVGRILLSVMDLFRPQIAALANPDLASNFTDDGSGPEACGSSPTADRCFIASGSLDIAIHTAKREWPTGGVLPLLVDRSKPAPLDSAAD